MSNLSKIHRKFTGYKDKNGCAIYEEDKIKTGEYVGTVLTKQIYDMDFYIVGMMPGSEFQFSLSLPYFMNLHMDGVIHV